MDSIPPEPTPEKRPEPMPVPPDLLAWAQQTFNMEEYLAGVADIKAGNGKTFEEVIAKVQQIMDEP